MVVEYSVEQGVRVLHTVGKVQVRAEWSNTSHKTPLPNVAQSHNCSYHHLKFFGRNPVHFTQLIEGVFLKHLACELLSMVVKKM